MEYCDKDQLRMLWSICFEFPIELWTVFIRGTVHETVIIPDVVTAFENDCGNIPYRMSGLNFTLYSSALKSLIQLKNCVEDSAISAILDLDLQWPYFNIWCTISYSSSSCRAHKVIQLVSDFVSYQSSPSGLSRLLVWLRHCQLALIPLFNGAYTVNDNH